MENGYDIRKASNVTTDIARSGFEDTTHQRLLSDTNFKKNDPGSVFEKRSSIGYSDPLKHLNRTASELYLQGLREYIAEKKGTLGVGWNVEFKFCHKRCKTSAVYHGPDGSTFESMVDVASHLGLPSGVRTIEMENGGNRFSLVHKESNNMLKRKDASGPMQTRSCNQSSNAPRSSFLESGAFLQNIKDGFPVQFEDFLLISTGHLDSRPSYHSNNQIWPVGYRSSWHDKLSGSIFVCDVTDGGDSSPKFRVQRYPCSIQSYVASSTVLSRPQLSSSSEYDKVEKDDSTVFGVLDDDSISVQIMLGDCSPPTLDNDNDTYTGQREDEDFAVEKLNSSLPVSVGNKTFDVIGQGDSLGEFLVEGSSLSSVWEMVSQTLLLASHEAYKQKGAVQFCCSHDICELDVKQLDSLGPLSKFSCLAAPSNFPRAVHSDSEFNSTCEMLVKWFEQDRFGLDADFVQEILEQLPGILNCSGYKLLSERKHKSTLRTVGSGFLQSKRKSHMQDDRESYEFFRPSKRLRKLEEESEVRGPCPLGKPFMSKLPSYLIGDALQVWDFSLRFSEVLGLEDPFSFWELEDELLSPWIDGLNPSVNQESDIVDAGDTTVYGDGVKSSQGNVTYNQESRCTGLVLAKTHSFLLNVLVKDLLMKVAVYVDPNFDVAESKPRRGRKKDADNLATLKKAKLDMFPVNEVTWPEIARRYILAVLSMEGNLDSTETACRESGKIFHCLRGDGGTLCGSLMGVAALEADAVLLAEAKRKIYGSLKIGSDVISIDEKESDAACTNDGEVPEWARVLEPVRKLPTNVGARIRKCINEALDKNPPEWARKILEHSISKEVYKGNASGPTKRAVISVLADLNNENVQLKPEKKEKVKSVSSLSDIIMKQCRIVLRQAIVADEDRVFCNLLGRTVLMPNDNDDEGRLGYPAMVSRPLDFRTIDLRLAAGSYGGSYEAFVDDVREVWNNICTAYGDQPDLLSLAGTLSQKFEELYEKEVLSFVQKTVECKDNNCLNSEAEKESDDFISRVNESSLPKAPWDEGICKVCGMDKDDDNVLLCDSCDSEYHTYCLDPPLVRIPDGNWYCPSCVAKKSLSRSATYITQNVGQCRKKRYQKEFSHKLLEALSELAKAMELKEYWELTLQERIFLMKFLCDEALNSAIIRDHIDQCASLSADLQQKLRSLNSELKVLKLREEFFTADLAKVKNNVGHGGDSGSNAFSSGVVSDGKLNGQVPESGAQSLSSSFRQLDNGGQLNELMDNNKKPRSCTSKDSLEETCATSVNRLKSTDTLSNLQYPQAVKDKYQPDNYCHTQSSTQVARLQNELVQGNAGSNVDFQQESPESSSNSLPSTAHVLPDHNSTGSLSSSCVNQSSNPGDVSFSQAFNLQLASLKSEIRSLQDSISVKESELYKVSIRKEFLGRDSEGRPYWILGRSGSCLQIVANAGVCAQQRLSPNFYHSGMDNSRQFGVLDWYASGDNVGIPNFCQWTTYQSDEEVKELLEWLRDNDTRERELKESILQWVSYKSKHSNFADGLIQKKKDLSASDSSKGRKVSDSGSSKGRKISDSGSSKGRKVLDSCFLVTKAMTVLSKKFGSFNEMDGTEVCKNPGLPVKVPCKGGIYRCLCLEPLWISRPHCYSCHQTFSNAEELAQHASNKCKSNSEFHESSQIMENSSKRKKVTRSESCQEKSLASNGINQASKSRKQGSVPAFRNEKHNSESASVEHQDQAECPFKFEEIKRKFIVQSSLKEEIKKIGLIGSNGVPSFIPCRSPYLDYPVGLFHTTEDEVATEITTVAETCQQQSNTGPSIPGKVHILDNLPSNENGIFDDELELGRGRSTLSNEKNQLSSVKVKSQALGINKSFTVRESSVRPLVGRDFEILRRLKINLLDMDAALPEEALRASRSHSDRRYSWRAFVKSAATVYEMIQATIILEDTIKTEYLRNDWWYWSSPSAAAKISTLSALALRLYALDSAILYEKHLANEEATEASKPECQSEKAAPQNSKSGSPPTLKQPDSEPAESSKTKTRASKRRKDSGG
nr:methyl-cpg-binding domain-containing protein 9 [Ipomoea batatas]